MFFRTVRVVSDASSCGALAELPLELFTMARCRRLGFEGVVLVVPAAACVRSFICALACFFRPCVGEFASRHITPRNHSRAFLGGPLEAIACCGAFSSWL